MPPPKFPGIPGVFCVQEAKKGPPRRDVFWGMPSGKTRVSAEENKIFFVKGHDENRGPFSFSREKFRRCAGCQSLQKAKPIGPMKVS